MQKFLGRFVPITCIAALILFAIPAASEKLLTLETKHYRVAYAKKHAQLAGEVLQVAESVWPTLAKAYDAYDNYQRIDIRIEDEGDDANGYAIYNFSSVAIYAPHMDWVMRNRQMWIENVVTHELAHVFSLRRAAYLSPLDAVELYGSTYNYADNINYSFHIPWIPLIAPTWYVEGIAQFEAYMNGNDTWDSQRDMIVRDAYLTGTLPSLDFIETFEYDEDWTQAERCYNTGYIFLIYLKDRFGADKVRDLAKPKPLANFSWSVEKVFGKPLPLLFEDFKKSLVERYADYKDIPKAQIADPEMKGGYQQDLAFSRNGRYMAWLGNEDDRRFPLNSIYWKDIKSGKVAHSKSKVNKSVPAGASDPTPAPTPTPSPTPAPEPVPQSNLKSAGHESNGIESEWGTHNHLQPHFGNPALALGQGFAPQFGGPAPRRSVAEYVRDQKPHREEPRRSEEFGSAGLEFNHNDTRLLTTRQDKYAQYTDIWDYEFRAQKKESDKWRRLTWEERAGYPSYHPSKNLIVYSRKKGGSSNLTLLDSTGRNWQITNFTSGEQVYNPRFTPAGDSIYFTLGISNKEAIASMSASAPGFNSFLSLKDSAEFPDSLNLAKSQTLNFITPMRPGGIRHIRFFNDTLYWSSNSEDSLNSVYDIYARIPGDSAVYRATKVTGQALEPIVREGTLYYQGYQKQQFRIFQQPLSLTKTNNVLGSRSDSASTRKPKKLDYTKAFETGEFSGKKVALDITPFLNMQPVFLSGNRSYTDLALGLNMQFGDSYGGWIQSVSGAMTKRTRLDAPVSYQFSYSGYLNFPKIRHTRHSWEPNLYYSLYHDQKQYSEQKTREGRDTTPFGIVRFRESQSVLFTYNRNAASAGIGLPYNFALGSRYFSQHLTFEVAESGQFVNETTGETNDYNAPRFAFLRDAQEHRHYESNLGWGWSKGKIGTYLPTGIGFWGYVHKYWATYSDGQFELDPSNLISLSQAGKVAPRYVLTQSQFDPWSANFGVDGVLSPDRNLSLFMNAEAGAFLNKFPTVQSPAHITSAPVDQNNPTGYDTTSTASLHPGLWVLTYQLGYYKLSGYPYNFTYRGRDLMEGSSYAFGQYGFSVPVKTGKFISGFPTTSFKQIVFTGIGEWGTTLISSPDKIITELENGEHHLLLDFGARVSFHFRLYHQLPFTIFAQAFLPVNQLNKENLFWFDYEHTGKANDDGTPSLTQLANEPADRERHIQQVKQPRFYVGLNLGFF